MTQEFYSSSNSRYDYGDVTFLDGVTQLTFGMWVLFTNNTADMFLYSKYNGTNAGLLFLKDDVGSATGRTDTFKIFIRISSSTTSLEGATGAAKVGVWQYIVATIDMGSGGVTDLWVDGLLDPNSGVSSSGIGSFPNVSQPFRIGLRSDTTGGPLDGQVKDPATWDTILTPNEIRRLYYDHVPARCIRPASLIFNPDYDTNNTVDPYSGAIGTVTAAQLSEGGPILHRQDEWLYVPAPVLGGSIVPLIIDNHNQYNGGMI